MEKNERDAIDFGKENIPKLFRQMLIPTIIGMLFAASMTITDGIFVGRFVGSDALAAVNIVAPFFMLATGIGLMFGVGVSVVASVHLSRGRVKAANINITQAYSVSLFFTLIASALGLVFDWHSFSAAVNGFSPMFSNICTAYCPSWHSICCCRSVCS